MERDRDSLLRELEVAKRRLSAGALKIAHQGLVIESLRSTESDLGAAQEVLRSLETAQDIFAADIERILDELHNIAP